MARKKQLSITNYNVLSTVKKILAAVTKFDMGFHEDWEIRSTEADIGKKVQAILVVRAEQDNRKSAAADLIKKISSYKYIPSNNGGQTGVSHYVYPHTSGEQFDVQVGGPSAPPALQKLVVRVLVKPASSGGSRGGSGGASVTESAHALYCALRFNVFDSDIPEPSATWTEDNANGNALITMNDFSAAIASCQLSEMNLDNLLGINLLWQISCVRAANKLYNALNNPPKNSYTFTRGAGVDALINAAYLQVKRTPGVGAFEPVPEKEDKWNPADIWLLRSDYDTNRISQAAQAGFSRNLNREIELAFDDKKLIGVSLKKITGTASLTVINKDPINERSRGLEFQGQSTNPAPGLKSMDTYLEMGKGYQMQFRNFSGSKAAFQGELAGAAAAQGKIGGGLVWTILNKHGVAFNYNPELIWRRCVQEPAAIATEIFNLILQLPKQKMASLVAGKTEAQNREFIESMITGTRADIADIHEEPVKWRYSKYIGLSLLVGLQNLAANNKPAADEACIDLYLYASSQTATSSIHWKLQ